MSIENKINRILSYKSWSIKKRVDALLEEDATLYTMLGIDSTKTEKKRVKMISRKIYKAISRISPEDGKILEPQMTRN